MRINKIIAIKILFILIILFLKIKIIGQNKDSLLFIDFNFNRYSVCDLEGNFEIYFFVIDSNNIYKMFKPIIIKDKIKIEDDFYKNQLLFIIFKYKNFTMIFKGIPGGLEDINSLSFTLGVKKYILKDNIIYMKGNKINNIDDQYITICNPNINVKDLSIKENIKINKQRRKEFIRDEKKDFKKYNNIYISICYSELCYGYLFKNYNSFFKNENEFFEKLKKLDGKKKD